MQFVYIVLVYRAQLTFFASLQIQIEQNHFARISANSNTTIEML